MKAILAIIALCFGVAHAAGSSEGTAAWKERNRGSATISSKMPVVAHHGAPTTASGYEMGQCAASIITTNPATAGRIYDEAMGRGERLEFFRGAQDYVDAVNKDPVATWQRGRQACSGHLLAAITFNKVDRNVAKD